jgi:hypothetical protein
VISVAPHDLLNGVRTSLQGAKSSVWWRLTHRRMTYTTSRSGLPIHSRINLRPILVFVLWSCSANDPVSGVSASLIKHCTIVSEVEVFDTDSLTPQQATVKATIRLIPVYLTEPIVRRRR